MALIKYIKQPISGSPAQYADSELRKIEQSHASLFNTILELLDMAAAIEKGTFVLTATGLTTTVQVTAHYARSGSIVVLYIPPVSGTSNATTYTLTGLPAALKPANDQGFIPVIVQNNGTLAHGYMRVLTTGVIQFLHNFSGSGFTASGLKGSDHLNASYILE